MKPIFITMLAGILLYSHTTMAQVGTVKLTNSVTKTEKDYQVGVEYTDIDVSNITGWNKCTVQPLKVFQFKGESRMRIDMSCYTKGNQMVLFSCTTGKGGYELTLTHLLATGSKLNYNNNISSSGSVEVALICQYGG